MKSVRHRKLFVDHLIFLVSIIMVVGMTACVADSNSSKADRNHSGAEKNSGVGDDNNSVEDNNSSEADRNSSRVDMNNSGADIAGREQNREKGTGNAQILSGTCGGDAVWKYDSGSKLLQITGTGVVDQMIRKSEEYVSESGSKKRYQVNEIQIGEGITALDIYGLFQNVVKAKEAEEIQISLPDSLEKIGFGSFISGDSEAEYIRHIHLPRKVRYIETGAFWGYGDSAQPYIYRSYQEDVKQITKKYKKKLEITVDSKNPYYTVKDGVLFTKDVKTLVHYPTEKTDKVYHIPQSVTYIKPLAFSGNSFLKEVVLPGSIQKIGAGAFYDDHRLAKINLEQAKKLKRICDFNGKKYGIYGNSGVPEGIPVEIMINEDDDEHYDDPEESKKYGYSLGTFAGTNLKSIQFPDRLEYASYNTFQNCYHLKKIYLGKSFAGEINPEPAGGHQGFLFPDIGNIKIKVSEGNQHYQIKNHVLYSRDGKTLYKVLNSFRGTTLVLDQNVQKIAREAFSRTGARKLHKVVVSGSLKQISREAFALSNIRSVEVYGNVDTIGIDAFFMCYDLKQFICHGTVKHIGPQAFYYCANLEKLSLGNHIESIGVDAFWECSGIKKPRVRKKGR